MNGPDDHELGERPTNVRGLVLVALATAAVNAYLIRVCTAPAASTIQRQMGYSDEQMGLIHDGFYFGYILSQIPGGWLGKRVGARRSLMALSLLWSAATLWTAWSHSFAMILSSRIAVGAAQGGLFPITALIITDWFPESRRGLASAVPTGFMSVGSVIANGLTVRLLPSLGWRGVFEAYAVVGIAWALLFYAWFRNRPDEHAGTNAAERKLIRGGRPNDATGAGKSPADSGSMLHALRTMATRLSMWALCSQSFFRAFGYAFFVTWFPTFLERTYGIRYQSAGSLTMLPLVAVVLGSLSGGVLVDAVLTRTRSRWLSRSGVAAVALAACALATLASAYVREAAPAVLVMALGSLFFGLSGPTTWAATIDIGGKQTAIVFAVMNIAGNLGAIACPIAVAALMAHLQRTSGDLHWVVYLMALIYLAAAASWVVLDPNQSAVEPARPEDLT